MTQRVARDRAVAAYEARHGERPRWVASAPGRVNLIGEHTDYNDGFVLPMALDLRTVVAAGAAPGRMATVESIALAETVEIELGGTIEPGPRHWSNYVRGILAGFERQGLAIPGFCAVIESDVPVGGGLSSSAAIEVAMATLLEAIVGRVLDPRDKARLCQRAEHDFAGVPSGIMDQLVAIMATPGHALSIDCRSLEVEHVDVSDPDITVLIVNTNVRHSLVDGGYARRRAECVDAANVLGVSSLRDVTIQALTKDAGPIRSIPLRRARHVVSENARVAAAVDAIRHRDWLAVGALMSASHASLRDDFDVSCRELDVLTGAAGEIGLAGGVFGCRMTGGGFGGSVVCLVRTAAVGRVSQTLGEAYFARTGRTATAVSSRAGSGTRVDVAP